MKKIIIFIIFLSIIIANIPVFADESAEEVLEMRRNGRDNKSFCNRNKRRT